MLFRILTVSLVLATGACTKTPLLPVEGELATVIMTEGVPELQRNARPYMLARESRLFAGDVVVTDANSIVTLSLASGTELTLGPQSQMRLLQIYQSPAAFHHDLNLPAGNLIVAPTGASHFSIRTNIAQVESDNAGLWITYSADSSRLDVVTLNNGNVDISNRDGRIMLTERLQATSVASGVAPRDITSWSEARLQSVRARRLRTEGTVNRP